MRLVTRMSSTTALAGLLVFGAYGVWLVRSERHDLFLALDREVAFLATSLKVSAENALRDGQTADVEETISRLDEVDSRVDVAVFRPDGTPWLAPTGLQTGEARQDEDELARVAALGHREASILHPAAHPTYLILATPLFDEAQEVIGVLVLFRPLTDVNRDLAYTSGSVVAGVGFFVLLASGLGFAVGRVRLTRPLDRLLRAIRSIREGEKTAPLPEEGDEEIAALAAEFNVMNAELSAAYRSVQEESEARREALHALQAADRLVTVGQLSASLAHEIGSPLQVLHGRARSLVERPGDPERVRRSAGILVRETERITGIVAQFLALSRRKPARRVLVDLARISSEVVVLLEIEARRRRVSVEQVQEGDCSVLGDPDQLQQVVLNLLTNALVACKPGGWVTVKTVREGDRVRLVAADDGSGMSAETLARAFEPLFTTHADEGGTGLGLAVVRSIVEEHGGSVVGQSEVGRGSTFTVDLPAHDATGEIP
jgi:signal transduction histidine kinase